MVQTWVRLELFCTGLEEIELVWVSILSSSSFLRFVCEIVLVETAPDELLD